MITKGDNMETHKEKDHIENKNTLPIMLASFRGLIARNWLQIPFVPQQQVVMGSHLGSNGLKPYLYSISLLDQRTDWGDLRFSVSLFTFPDFFWKWNELQQKKNKKTKNKAHISVKLRHF